MSFIEIPSKFTNFIKISDDRVIRIKLADLEPIIQKKSATSELNIISADDEPSGKAVKQKRSKREMMKNFFSKK